MYRNFIPNNCKIEDVLYSFPVNSNTDFCSFRPINLLRTPVVDIFIPVTFSWLIVSILSPALMPTFSDGPPPIGSMIIIESRKRLN